MSLSMLLHVFLNQLHFLVNTRNQAGIENQFESDKSNLEKKGNFEFRNSQNRFPLFIDVKNDPKQSEFDLFDFADILFIPIVNLDGYSYINQNFGRQKWDETKKKRKNFNNTITCT